MKDRLLTFALATAAFVCFYVLIAPKPAPPQETVTRPVSTERGANGYHALAQWLERAGVPTLSLRERFTRLAQTAPSAEGNLLITTAPHLYPLRSSEVAPLRAWIAQGNTLLVAAGLSDTPEWSIGEGADPELLSRIETLTGLTFTAVAQADALESAGAKQAEPDDDETTASASAQAALVAMQRLVEPERFEVIPNAAHPLLERVQTVIAQTEYPTGKWRANAEPGRLVLELARESESDVPALWLRQYGEGQIILSAYGSLFTNKLIGERDNARLLANMVRWSVRDGGRVLIDDAHQGLVSFYDAQAFFGDERLHASLWWLVALWLVFVLGPQRLRVGGAQWNPLDVTSFVRATGGFMARVLLPQTAAQRLFERFFDDVRRRSGTSEGAPVWRWIGSHTAIASQDLEQLQAMHADVLHGRRVDLPKLQTLLARTHQNLI